MATKNIDKEEKELKRNLINIQNRLEVIALKKKIRPIEDYSIEEKITVFNAVYKQSKWMIEDGSVADENRDNERWCFELVAPVASSKSPKEFWKSLYD